MSSAKFGYNLDGRIVCQLCKANALMNLKAVYKRLLIILTITMTTLTKPWSNHCKMWKLIQRFVHFWNIKPLSYLAFCRGSYTQKTIVKPTPFYLYFLFL